MKFFQNKFIAIVALAFFINSILVYIGYFELELFWSKLFSNDTLLLSIFINYSAAISLIYLITYIYYYFRAPKEITNAEISDIKPTKETNQKLLSNEDKNQILKDIFYNYKVAFRMILYSLLFIIIWALIVLLISVIIKDVTNIEEKEKLIKNMFSLSVLFAIIVSIVNIVSISTLLNASKEAEKF